MPLAGNAQTELPRIAARLQLAGPRLRRQAQLALAEVTIPVIAGIQREAGMDFPKSGGMNVFMQKRKPRKIVKTTGRNIWIRVQYTGKGRYADEGPWLHPMFGRNRTPKPNASWKPTSFPRTVGYYEKGAESARPVAEALMDAVLVRLTEYIERGGI